MYVYIECGDEGETSIFTVGFFDPHGVWVPETDWETADDAAARVHFLNGGNLLSEQDFERLQKAETRNDWLNNPKSDE